jgi:hypothetical protein
MKGLKMTLHPDDKMDKVSVLHFKLDKSKDLFSGDFDTASNNTISLKYTLEVDLEDFIFEHGQEYTKENIEVASDFLYDMVDSKLEDDLVSLLNLGIKVDQIENAYVEYLSDSTLGYEIHIIA